MDAGLRTNLHNTWVDRKAPEATTLTETQEVYRRPHGAIGLLDDQRPQLDEERGIHLGPL